MKRIAAALIMIIIFSFTTISCSVNTFKDDKVVEGNYNIWAYGDYYSYLKEIADKFMKINPKIKINIKNENITKYKENFKTAIDKKELPSAVLFKGSDMIDIINYNSKCFRNISSDIDGIKKKFTEARLDQVINNQEIYGIPIDCRPLVMIIDKAKMEKYGFEASDINTWQDAIKIGNQIYSKSKGDDCLFKITSNQETEFISILVRQFKQSDENFNLINDADLAVKKAGSIINQLKKTNTLKIVDEQFTGVASIGSYKEAIELNKKSSVEGYVVSNIPTTEAGGDKFISLEGNNLLVTNNGENIEGLIEFIKYVVNDENSISAIQINGIYSANTTVYMRKVFDNSFSRLGEDKLLDRMSNIILKEEDIKSINKMNNFIKENRDSIMKNEYSALF